MGAGMTSVRIVESTTDAKRAVNDFKTTTLSPSRRSRINELISRNRPQQFRHFYFLQIYAAIGYKRHQQIRMRPKQGLKIFPNTVMELSHSFTQR